MDRETIALKAADDPRTISASRHAMILVKPMAWSGTEVTGWTCAVLARNCRFVPENRGKL
jgi:hypothetical protein